MLNEIPDIEAQNSPASDTPPDAAAHWNAGAWLGREQAFAVLANHCSAAQALALKQLKDGACHQPLGLSWDQFCTLHLGISRRHADRLIARYDEFGEAFFRLAALARVSPDDYRSLAPAVADNCIEIEGEQIALVPENAPRIRAFLATRRASTRKPDPPAVADLNIRLRALLEDYRRHVTSNIPNASREFLLSTVQAAIYEWQAIARRLERQLS